MSDEKDYPMRVRVEVTGYDTIRYAVLSVDTMLNVQARLSGYYAFLHAVDHTPPVLTLNFSDKALRQSVSVANINERLKQSIRGARDVVCGKDSIRLVLAPRASRSYVVDITGVRFSFADQYGLYGEPAVNPAEVVLYGPEEILDSINVLSVSPTVLANINESDTYRLPIEPVWNRFPGVYPSCTEVNLTVPVEPYVEREYSVPITVEGADSTVMLRLYPEEVTLRAWVAQRDLHRDPRFSVVVDYADAIGNNGTLTPQLVYFPSFVRPRSVEPSEVQCVIIK